jgi:uncharacterized protein (DUF362 family)
MSSRPRVILRHCPSYDVQAIRRIVREGLSELQLRPSGRTLLKPNIVAAGKHFSHAYTRPEFAEGVLLALRDRDGGMTQLGVGERCGITMPTRYAFEAAGYSELARRDPELTLFHFDEVPQVEIPLYHPDRLRDCLYVPEPVARADFFVNCPKFKAHPWTTVTFSMKNYIGIQDDRHRLLDHDHRLNSKVADLQYVLQPRFIAIDAIVAGQGRMLTPVPFDLGLIIMGDNQVAVDSVCCQIINQDPRDVEHIALAHERGFGPIDLDSLEISGDVTLERAQQRAEGFIKGLIRVEDYFAGTHIRAYAGPPPGQRQDYCWGGCPGALEEAIEILRAFDRGTDQKLPPLHIVFGKYAGVIPAQPGEKVVFMGDCAEYSGELAGRPLQIGSRYVDRAQLSPLATRSEDIFEKMFKVGAQLWQNRSEQILRMPGCPVSVAEQILALVHLGGLDNPYFDPDVAFEFTNCYLSTRTRNAIQRWRGRPYHQPGPTERGAARPWQNLPPVGSSAALERSRS